MADIRPFRALEYNRQMIRDLGTVIAPPYDVISPDEQRLLYDKSEYNIVRLDLGYEFATDTATENRYTRAEALIKQWLYRGVVDRDMSPALHVYRQDFELGGAKQSRLGFVGLLRLESLETGAVVAHEKTLAKPKADRLALMHATSANLSSVFQLFPDPEGMVRDILERVAAGPSELNVVDGEGVQHHLWRIKEEEIFHQVHEALAATQLFIADGHHRYETALNYQAEMQKAFPAAGPDAAFNFVLSTLVPFESPGLVILPTHRLVRLAGAVPAADLATTLATRFEVSTLDLPGAPAAEAARLTALLAEQPAAAHAIVLVLGPQALLLKVKDEAELDGVTADGHSAAWRRLDVAILHTLVLDQVLGIGPDQIEERLEYTRDAEQAISQVRSGKFQVAALLQPTRIEDLQAIQATREKMPEKSTYFYPKLITGLLMNRIEPNEEIILP